MTKLPSSRTLLVPVICVTAGLWLSVFTGVGGYFIGRGTVKPGQSLVTGESALAGPTGVALGEPAKKTFLRSELSDKLQNYTESHALNLVGKPEKTLKPAWGRDTWIYKNVSVDPVTGKVDDFMILHFRSGVIHAIEFH